MVSVKQLAQRSSGLLATSIQSWLWECGGGGRYGLALQIVQGSPRLLVTSIQSWLRKWGWGRVGGVGKRGWWGQIWPGPADSVKIT